jgi:hypothetical protein
MNAAVPADRRDRALDAAFAGEVSVRELAAIARRTDSEPPHMICAWCPDFRPTDRLNTGVTHGLCPACDARLNAALDALEASR